MINIISFIIISFIVNFKIMRNLNLSPSRIVYQHHHHMYNINISQLTIWHHPLCGCFVNVFHFSIRTNLSPGRTVVMAWYVDAIQTQKPYNIHISLEWWKIACSYHLTMMIMIINMIWKRMLDLDICSNIDDDDDDVAVTTPCIIPSPIPHTLYNCCRFIIHFWWLQIGIKGWKKLMTMVSYVCTIRKNVP